LQDESQKVCGVRRLFQDRLGQEVSARDRSVFLFETVQGVAKQGKAILFVPFAADCLLQIIEADRCDPDPKSSSFPRTSSLPPANRGSCVTMLICRLSGWLVAYRSPASPASFPWRVG